MLIKMAMRNLLRNTRKSLAILLTLGLGTGALFVYHGFNFGIMNQYRINTIHSRYGHGQINEAGYLAQVYEKPWEHWMPNHGEVKEWLQDSGLVSHIFPRVSFFGLLTNGEINVSGKGEGIDASQEADFFTQLNIIEGEMLRDQEDGVIVGAGLARSLKVRPGDRMTVLANTIHGSLNGIDLTVTGIFHTGVKEFDDTIFRLQLKQAQVLLDTDKVESIAIGLKKDEHWAPLFSDFKEKFSTLESTPFAILDKVIYQNAIDFLKAQYNSIRFIILVIVIMGIFNSVSSSILERKHEIGTLRANGESVFDIVRLLLMEGIVLGFLGAIFGIILSYLLTYTLLRNGILMPASPGFTRQFHIMIELQFMYGFVTVTLGVLTAIIGVLLAGIKVAKTPISELLRAN
ncbi:MAG: ABC transporter permease [Bacteriovoracaceae bacterium]|nr:ABC transporter permease [Bacteriovoracaceae bacterium]